MKLRYTPEAIKDLQEIRKYICEELCNPKAAARISKMILDDCSRLKVFPQMGADVGALTGIETDLRMLVCENYVAVYRYECETISVARIFNAKQDFLRILFGENICVHMKDTEL